MVRILVIDDEIDEILKLHDYLKVNLTGVEILPKEKGYLSPKDGRRQRAFSEKEQIDRLLKILETQWESADLFLVDMALRGNLDENIPVSQQAIEKFLQIDSSATSSLSLKIEAINKREKIFVIITGRTVTISGLDLSKYTINKWILFEFKPDWKIGFRKKGGKVSNCLETCHNSTICDKYKSIANDGYQCYQNECLRNLIAALIT